MKTILVNESGNWAFWPKERLKALANVVSLQAIGKDEVFQNHRVKVWQSHLEPGEVLSFHKHSRPYFWTALSAGRSRSFYHDGSVAETIYEQGDTLYFNDLNDNNFFIHDLENIGETRLMFTTVEFLDK